MSRKTIAAWVRRGHLHRVHQGVYAVGHPHLSQHGVWMAAVLACGARSQRTVALSHRSAAALWGLLPDRSGPVDVTVCGDGGRAGRRGVRLHRSKSLAPRLITRRFGIPVTNPARTVLDLGRKVDGRRAASSVELRRAIRQADVLGLNLGPDLTPDRTRSELEFLFLDLCRRHSLPRPEVNVKVGRLEVDFLWRDRRLVVETDGFRFHGGRTAFERDRGRDLELRERGFAVVRVSHRQVVDEPRRLAALLQATLARSPA
jgi:very-short-patch-repair endonuclease